jgi:hypothetical protein
MYIHLSLIIYKTVTKTNAFKRQDFISINLVGTLRKIRELTKVSLRTLYDDFNHVIILLPNNEVKLREIFDEVRYI